MNRGQDKTLECSGQQKLEQYSISVHKKECLKRFVVDSGGARDIE